MKKLIVFVLLAFVGCTPRYYWKQPDGKTDVDMEREFQECKEKTGMMTGFLGFTTIGAINNYMNNTEKKYMQCLREKGWIE
ncbi:MAG: hypothetical protein ABFD76_15425 [Smithella sp.]